MQSVYGRWCSYDLISLAEGGIFNPDELQPRDWGALLPLIGALGTETARFGSNAFTTAASAVDLGRRLQAIAVERTLAGQRPSVQASADMLVMQGDMDQIQALIRDRAKLALELFEKALTSAPRWLVTESGTFKPLQ
jgi:hypothetical protein